MFWQKSCQLCLVCLFERVAAMKANQGSIIICK